MPRDRRYDDKYEWMSDKPLERQTEQRHTCYNCGCIIWSMAYNKYSECECRMVKVCFKCKEVSV